MDTLESDKNMVEPEIEEQRYGRNKNTTINHSFINSSLYRKKFDLISDSPNLNRLIYQLAKTMLNHRSGTTFEDMYWIDADKCKIVAKETEMSDEKAIIYSPNTIKKIKGISNLITIHSHPNSLPPSVYDLNSNFHNHYTLGIVVGHNGNLFLYSSEQEINSNYYHLVVEDFFKSGYTEYEAQILALREMEKRFDIECKEVTINGI